eukprot:COSAG02_NODE_3619_length_6464_cov_15.210683_3_plen_80_part_00
MTQATVAKELVKTYGVSGLYCGWYWAMMSGFMEKGIYFFAYGACPPRFRWPGVPDASPRALKQTARSARARHIADWWAV